MKLFFSLFAATAMISTNVCSETLVISTSKWQPYVNESKQSEGLATALLRQVYSQNNTQIEWLYQNYELAFEQVAKQEKLASFPYFKTKERQQRVLFSEPIFYATSHIYFNRQFNSNVPASELPMYRIGRVAGYSYGEKIDEWLGNSVEFSTEEQALKALLNHEIDFLPMTESVMNNMLNRLFKVQKLLIKSLSGISDTASLHLIASNNEHGEKVINELNGLLAQVGQLESMKLVPEQLKISPDIAKLVVSEGHPAILGKTKTNDEPVFYTLPQGTQVLVIKWSDKMLASSPSDSIYKNMMDFSEVLILNGPLVGRELLVRNMHLELL